MAADDELSDRPGGSVRQAFESEALCYLDALYGTALRLTRAGRCRGSGAGHVSQGVSFADRFERGTNLKAWLFTILHNTFRNMRRRRGAQPGDVDSETVEQAADAAGDAERPSSC